MKLVIRRKLRLTAETSKPADRKYLQLCFKGGVYSPFTEDSIVSGTVLDSREMKLCSCPFVAASNLEIAG